MFERWQAPISLQSMADWVRIAAFWLEPIYRLIGEGVLAGGYVQVDETPIRCRDPDQKRGKPFQGFLWVMGRPNSDVFFEWGPTHQYGQVNHLLGEDYDGILQSDVYEAYEAYARAHPEVVWVACWAHVRRRFFEAQSEKPKAVRVALELARRRQKHFARPLDWLDRLDQALR